MCCYVWQSQNLFKRYFCLKNGENGPKLGFLKFIGKFSYFFLNSVYNEGFYYLLYSCTNLIFGKNLVPEIWAKMLSANQATGFLNQLCLENKMMKKSDFLYIDTDSWKLEVDWKILWWVWSRMGCTTLFSGL